MSGKPSVAVRWSARAVVLAVLLSGRAFAQPPTNEPSITYRTPLPAWAEAIEVPVPTGQGEGGTELLLRDHQWRFDDRAVHLTRLAYRITSTAGLRQGSEVVISLASDQALEWHYARRTRDGRTEDVLQPERVRVIQPEARLDRGLYDEMREVLLFLEDMRVGDVVEIAYSRLAGTELLAGRHAAHAPIGRGPARRVHFAASWPASRSIRVRLHELGEGYRVTERDGGVRIDASDVARSEQAASLPEAMQGEPWIELTEYEGWDEVVDWALPHFAVDQTMISATLAEVPVERIRSAGTIEDQAEAALRFVQDEVRYLGLEVRERALVPHPPSEVARRRYGDCKDKSLLLVTLLRALGVEAAPALTHGSRGASLDEELPSPTAFNHVIVRAIVGGREVWLDPTKSFERGAIHARAPLSYRRALPIEPGSSALVSIPLERALEPQVEVLERFSVRRGRGSLAVTTTMRGDRASWARADLDALGPERMTERAIEHYRELGIEAHATEPYRAEEDPSTGALTLHERYAIGDYWEGDEVDIDAWAVRGELPFPEEDRPEAPLEIRFPLRIVHRIQVEDGRGWDIDAADQRVEDPAFIATRSVRVAATLLEIEVTLETLTDRVAAHDVDRFREHLDEAFELFVFPVVEYAQAPPVEPSELPLITGAILFGFFSILLIGGAAATRFRQRYGSARSRAFQRKQKLDAGESADRAIEVADLDEARARHAGGTCCGEPLSGGQWSRAQLAGTRIHVHSATCGVCGSVRRTYYREAKATA